MKTPRIDRFQKDSISQGEMIKRSGEVVLFIRHDVDQIRVHSSVRGAPDCFIFPSQVGFMKR